MKKFLIITVALLAYMVSNAQTEQPFKWLRDVKVQTARPYSCEMSAFYENGKWGFLNTDGRVAIAASYDEVRDFSQNLAIVKNEGKWGVIDKFGQYIFPSTYTSIEPFSDGIALATVKDTSYYLYLEGKKRVMLNQNEFHSYSDGMARVKEKGKWGYIGTNPKCFYIIEPIYDEATDFHAGQAVVVKKGTKYIVDKKGKKTIPTYQINDTYHAFDNGIAFLKSNNSVFIVKNNSRLAFAFKDYKPYSENLAMVKTSSGKAAYLNDIGNYSINPDTYDDAGNFHEGVAWVKIRNKFGYIDKTGQLVVDTIFNYASDFNSGLAYVSYQGRQGVIKLKTPTDFSPSVIIDSIAIADATGDKNVEADEQFSLVVYMTNVGTETAKDVCVSLSGNPKHVDSFSFSNVKIDVGEIEPRKQRTASFVGASNVNLVSGDINFNFKVSADNQFETYSMPIEFSAYGVNESCPVLLSYWVHTEDHSELMPGDTVTLMVKVQNDGRDIAKNVTVDLKWPNDLIHKVTRLHTNTLAPGETKTLSTTFSIPDSVFVNSYTIIATLSDFTKKHDDVKYLAFETSKRNQEVSFQAGFIPNNILPTYAGMRNISGSDNTPAFTDSELLMGINEMRSPDPYKYALIIGEEKYAEHNDDTGITYDVPYAENDANAFAVFAEKVLGVPQEKVIKVTNATTSVIKRKLNALEKMSITNPGEMEIYVYYAGHGQVDPKTKQAYLIPIDGSLTSPAEGGIAVNDVYALLNNAQAKKTVVFIDACYSGVGRGMELVPAQTSVKGNLIVMTSSSSIQKAMPYTQKRHGMFTYFMLKALKDAQGDISISDLFEKVKKDVYSTTLLLESVEQTPELIKGPSVGKGWEKWKL